MPARKNLAFEYLISKIEKLFKEENVKERHARFIEFVEERTIVLEQNARIKKISIKENSFYSGFIHPESQIIVSVKLPAFQVDDDEMYFLFLERLYRLHKMTFKNILLAIMQVLEHYFGDNWLNATENERLLFFENLISTKEPISLTEFKGKGIAECAEKAAVAQNLLVFLGLDTKLVISDECHLDHFGDNVHAFNIIKYRDTEYIFDPTNPQLVFRDTKSLENILPAYYQITTCGLRKLKDDGVEVIHQNLIKRGNIFLQKDLSYRIYSI